MHAWTKVCERERLVSSQAANKDLEFAIARRRPTRTRAARGAPAGCRAMRHGTGCRQVSEYSAPNLGEEIIDVFSEGHGAAFCGPRRSGSLGANFGVERGAGVRRPARRLTVLKGPSGRESSATNHSVAHSVRQIPSAPSFPTRKPSPVLCSSNSRAFRS